ncbi:MAG: L,D-transpeptidase [Verrucomicrobiota bacterium]
MKKSGQTKIHISVREQKLVLKDGRRKLAEYPVSTSRFGLGTEEGSMKTPTGKFRIAKKIGANMPAGTVFKSRRPVKATRKLLREEDLVMTRILWLDGVSRHNANTRDRYIYIHGTNHEERIGEPASHGCIRMRSADLLELFALVSTGTAVTIAE